MHKQRKQTRGSLPRSIALAIDMAKDVLSRIMNQNMMIEHIDFVANEIETDLFLFDRGRSIVLTGRFFYFMGDILGGMPRCDAVVTCELCGSSADDFCWLPKVALVKIDSKVYRFEYKNLAAKTVKEAFEPTLVSVSEDKESK